MLAIAGCGGGGGAGAAPNDAPTVAISGPGSAAEGDAITLSAAESVDPDGTIAGFAWEQAGGPPAWFGDASASTLAVRIPLVAGPTALAFRVTVTDDDGAVASRTISVDAWPRPRPSRVEVVRTFAGRDRTYTVYTPAGFSPSSRAVLLLHGGGQSMRRALEPGAATDRWLGIADEDGTLVIVPNGYDQAGGDGLGDTQSWNDIRSDGSGRLSLEDDEGFLLAVLDDVALARPFDQARLFVTGPSNGGFMTFRMLVNQGHRFAAGAAFIAAMPEQDVPLPPTARPVMIFNGTDDPLVRYGGGEVARGGAPSRSVEASVDYWLEANGAAPGSRTISVLADVADDGCLIERTSWADERGNPAVVFYKAIGGGHAIPDTTPRFDTPMAFLLIGRQCSDVHGVDLAAAFFDSIP